MMMHGFGILRRFRFNLPQRVAAGLLGIFLIQGLWLALRQKLPEHDEQSLQSGREMRAQAAQLAGYFTACDKLPDGILACRLAGAPLALNLLGERVRELFRNSGDEPSPGKLRRQLMHILLLERLPFLAVGCLLGGGLWWVTRRLYGNLGGYTALALYCFSPAVLKASVSPHAGILAALGIYGGVYTAIGVAHAMQGPAAKWRSRIVLLTLIFGVAAGAHIAALLLVALLGLAVMLWVAEGSRSRVLPVLLLAVAGALVLVFVCYGFSPEAFSNLFRSAAGFLWLSLDPARRFFSALSNLGITVSAAAAGALYLGARRSRYFGNTAPLFCVLVLFPLVTTSAPGVSWLWALPFLLTFVGGVFADAYEGPRGRLALGAAGAIVLLQAVFCVLSLPGLL
jgi:hypothetical protein